jgi:hypothetical protein
VKSLLEKRFGEEWKNESRLQFYVEIVNKVPAENDDEMQPCNCLDEEEGLKLI